MDHGQDGYDETKEVIRNAGVVYSNSEEIGVINVKGIQIAMLSYLCIDRYDKPVGGYANLYDKVAADIRSPQRKNIRSSLFPSTGVLKNITILQTTRRNGPACC